MSNTQEEDKNVLPLGLPKCDCFNTDKNFSMMRCAEVSRSCSIMMAAFNELARQESLCPDAKMYFVELLVVTLLTGVAKNMGPALQYGSVEIEWEVERLLNGMEARVLEKSRDVYARGREAGLTEETVKAMYERAAQGGNQS